MKSLLIKAGHGVISVVLYTGHSDKDILIRYHNVQKGEGLKRQ